MKTRIVLRWFAAAVVVVCGRGEALSQTDFWQKITGPKGDTVNAVAINARGTIFAGTRGGVAHSTDEGVTWMMSKPGLTLALYRFAFSSNGTIVAIGPYGLYRSTDNGSTWTLTTNPGVPVKTLAINDSGHIFVGWGHESGGGVERSTDSGASWFDAGLRANSYALAINASGILFSGGWKSDGACVSRSTDNGSTWSNTGLPAGYYPVNALAISPAGHIFVGTSSDGIFRSTNNGVRWTQTGSPLAVPYVTAFAFNAIGHIFAAVFDRVSYAGLGIFRSTDDGASWGAVNSGLTDLNVGSLAIGPSGTLFAVTGDGLFRSIQSTTAVEAISSDRLVSFSLKQNYPNPFNPSTMISYSLPQRSHVTLTVFTMLGQRVAELVNGDIDAGYHEVQFNASNLASGFYFCRLQAGSYVETKKLLLCR